MKEHHHIDYQQEDPCEYDRSLRRSLADWPLPAYRYFLPNEKMRLRTQVQPIPPQQTNGVSSAS